MSDAGALTLAFLRVHPGDAARVLETAAPAARAELFQRIPVRIGSEVLAQMMPRSAAQTLAALSDERAAELVARMRVQRAVAMLQHVDEPRRRNLIAALPTASALATRLLLGYSENEVGSHMDPAILALGRSASVGDALQRVIHSELFVDRIFAVEEDGRLLGWLPLDVLLRAPPAAAIDTLNPRGAPSLPARTPLASAESHPGWQQASVLPVVDHGNRLIGTLTRDALDRATQQPRNGGASADPAGDSLSGAAVRAYWQGLSAILRVLLMLLPPIEPAGRRHEG